MIADSLNWGVALVPVIVLLAVFIWLDAFRLMSGKEVLILILVGGFAALASYPVSGRLLDQLPIGFSSYSRFVAPWIEEAVKAVAIIVLFRLNRIGYKIDAVISGFAIGAGFSVVENVIYLTIFPEYDLGTWLVRGVGTAVMHGTTLAMLAAVAHELAERETRQAAGEFNFNLLWFVPGYVIAVGLHAAFNQFPDRPMLAMLGAIIASPILMLGALRFGTAEAERWLAAESVAHKAQLDTLRSGGWPDSPAGRKIAALAERSGTENSKRIRRYWELRAWLVVQAEEVMLEEATGDASFDSAEVEAAIAEMAGLRRAMGRSTFAALRALLPFSRNDDWEVAELRQRLR